MDNFAVIYKILKALEASMDYEEVDFDSISHERYNITYQRWERIMIMLADNGYVSGLVYSRSLSDYTPHLTKPIRPVITLKGLEYLNENSFMKKAANLAKGIKDTIPGL